MGESEQRYENNYRLPKAVIDRWTRICVWVLIGGIVVGAGLAVAGGIVGQMADEQGNAGLGVVSMVLLIGAAVLGGGGFLFGLGASAYLGGEALERGGGWVGIIFVLGLLGFTAGDAIARWAMVVGIVLFVLGIAGFILMGVRAKVPMWLQLPVFGSPRMYVRGKPGPDAPPSVTLPNELDGRDE